MESTKLLEILKETIILVSLPDNEFIWTSWRGSEEAVEILQDISAEISAGNLSRLPEVKLLFAPTGSLQELSLASGWGQEYLTLARRFDYAVLTFPLG